MIKRKHITLAVLGVSLFTVSCSDDEPNDITQPTVDTTVVDGVEIPNDGTIRYTVALRPPGNGSANGTTDYLVNVSSLQEGTISATNQGIEQLGWRSYGYFENKIYSLSSGAEDKTVLEYSNNSLNELQESGKFVFQNTLDAFGISPEGFLAIEAPRLHREKTFFVVDKENLTITNSKKQFIYNPQINNTSVVAVPTATVISKNKVYIPFYLSGSLSSTPFTDTAYVAVFTYPDLDKITIMKDPRTGPLGIYGSQNGLIADEQGNMYGFSVASKAGGFTTIDKTSAILKIKNGATTFDQDYFYDFEAASGKKINWMSYLGNGKALARVFDDVDQLWAAFPNNIPVMYIMNYVIIDLEAKSYIDVSGVPDHFGQFNAPSLVDGNYVYVSVTSQNEAAVYYIDIVTGEAKKGAIIEGEEIAHFSKI